MFEKLMFDDIYNFLDHNCLINKKHKASDLDSIALLLLIFNQSLYVCGVFLDLFLEVDRKVFYASSKRVEEIAIFYFLFNVFWITGIKELFLMFNSETGNTLLLAYHKDRSDDRFLSWSTLMTIHDVYILISNDSPMPFHTLFLVKDANALASKLNNDVLKFTAEIVNGNIS